MGSCCEPNRDQIIHSEEREGNKTDLPTRAGTSLNATSLAGLREKYDRWLKEKDEVIRKNEDEAKAKEEKVKVLQQAGKRLECQKVKRQIDTHLKLVKQAQEEKLKIQQKIDNL